MNFTLKKKLIVSFTLILVVIMTTAIFNLWSVSRVADIQHQITQYRMKTVNASKDIDNGINQSLAALRGFIILGNDPAKANLMKTNRAIAWSTIDSSIAALSANSQHLTQSNKADLAELIATLAQFKIVQKRVESIAQSPTNIPAYQLLLSTAAPKASELLNALTRLIDIESTLPASPQRKVLLKSLADSRGSLATGVANIRAYLLSGDAQFKRQFDSKWAINSQRFNEINNSLTSLFNDEQNINWNTYIRIRRDFQSLPAQMFTLRGAKDWNKANYFLGIQAAPLAKKSLALLKEIQDSQGSQLDVDIKELNDVSDWQYIVIIASGGFSLLLCIVIGLLFSKDLLSRLLPLLDKANAITNNQLTAPALTPQGNDELTQLTRAVNAMNDSLADTIRLTANTMKETSTQADNIYNANTNMSDDITVQNDQMSLIAAAIEELSASASEVSNISADAAASAQSSYETAKSGGSIVEKSLKKMAEISGAFDESATSVTALSQQSQQIGEILSVIRGIAEQTNLLALNAAIEAARAGEQGRGFAVVADEVRHLASRTTQATSDVEVAIEHMHNHTNVAVASMTTGREKVVEGIGESQAVAAILDQIIDQASDVSHRVESIAATAKQQLTVTLEIASNSDEASRMSRQVSASISDVVSLSENVSKTTHHNALQLNEMIG